MINVLQKKIFIILIVLVGLAGFVVWYFYQIKQTEDQLPPPVIQEQKIDEQPATSSITSPISGFKTYRNEEFGFEFQYLKDLVLKENTFRSYYSKFNLEIFVKLNGLDPVFLVNIVLPEFAEHSFADLKETASETAVAGVKGIKYQYKYKGFQHTTVIVPLGNLRMILATGEGSKQYLNEFNQILASFKFLK